MSPLKQVQSPPKLPAYLSEMKMRDEGKAQSVSMPPIDLLKAQVGTGLIKSSKIRHERRSVPNNVKSPDNAILATSEDLQPGSAVLKTSREMLPGLPSIKKSTEDLLKKAYQSKNAKLQSQQMRSNFTVHRRAENSIKVCLNPLEGGDVPAVLTEASSELANQVQHILAENDPKFEYTEPAEINLHEL
jgi:hypothetical protein